MSMIKVAGTSRTSAVAGAIAGVFRDNKRAEAQAIGAIAVNQVIKAIILARSYLNEDGYDIQVTPEFADVEIDGKTRTAIKFIVEERPKTNGAAGVAAPEVASPGIIASKDGASANANVMEI